MNAQARPRASLSRVLGIFLLAAILSACRSPVNFTARRSATEVFKSVKPGLASRATGCIMCHARVDSNIITDFGFSGNGRGVDYFFGGGSGVLPSGLTNTQGGSVYGDYDFTTSNPNWGAADLTATALVMVPKAPTLGVSVTQPSLAEYLRSILAQSTVAESKSVQVKEVKSLYIGAPTADRIRAAAGLAPGEKLKFLPANPGVSMFSGITLDGSGAFYTNPSGATVTCDGDVIVDGILWLNNPLIATESGCRFYVTQSVFITGPVTYAPNASEKPNLQISSARMIALGVGHTCNASGAADSIATRLTLAGESRLAGFFTRGFTAPTDMLAAVKADADAVPGLQDAACGNGGRAVGFDHMLLNAPVVHSRYQGQFNGSIVAEITLTSLNSLIYSFDPLFMEVPVLPLIDPEDFLMVNE